MVVQAGKMQTYQAGGSEMERRERDAVEATVLAPGRAGVHTLRRTLILL